MGIIKLITFPAKLILLIFIIAILIDTGLLSLAVTCLWWLLLIIAPVILTVNIVHSVRWAYKLFSIENIGWCLLTIILIVNIL